MLIAASVLWSLSGAAVKLADLHPLTFAFWRSVAATASVALVLPLGRGNWPRPGWMLASAVMYTIVVALLVTSMTVSTAATGILLQYTGPVFCALFAWAFQGRAIGRRTLIAMAIATAGIGVMVIGGWKPGNWVGPTCGLLSGAAFGALILLLEKNDRAAGGVNPFVLMLVNNGVSALLLLPLCARMGVLRADRGPLAIVLLIGVVQLALPYLLFQLALRRVRPVDASLLILLEPVLNPVWVALVTSERPDRATLMGGAAILVAMVVEATKPSPGKDVLTTERVERNSA